MSVRDFVCYVLKVPVNITGFTYTCMAIENALDDDSILGFYNYITGVLGKSYASVEKNIRAARKKAAKLMSPEDFNKIYPSTGIKNIEFIYCAAEFYRKEFLNENKN